MIEALTEGFSMMLIGMGTVLMFLLIMILSMNIMAVAIRYINKLCPEVVAESKAKKTSSSDEEIALAVAVAMKINREEI